MSDLGGWLILATARYVRHTGDHAILDEVVPFLSGAAPSVTQRSVVGFFASEGESGTLYEHCVRAVERMHTVGSHGLALIGDADWNDGMSEVGGQGKGESVWLTEFLIEVMTAMAGLSADCGEDDRVTHYLERIGHYRAALDGAAWDGRWYRRAFRDDGAIVGSSGGKEHRIDTVVQSWAYVALGKTERTARALHSAVDELRILDGLVPISWPPTHRTGLDLGKASDYPPGVRENASQYNHAALWFAQALFGIGEVDLGYAVVDAVNPIKRSVSDGDVARYQGEPYVVAAEVYTSSTYPGRAGWTWYTASAGVLYRLVLETILGLRREGDTLSIQPAFPGAWNEASIILPYGRSRYRIEYVRGDGAMGAVSITHDGVISSDGTISLRDDGEEHRVRVTLS
jgi:cyclic beta-1,2-glucan synthetase